MKNSTHNSIISASKAACLAIALTTASTALAEPTNTNDATANTTVSKAASQQSTTAEQLKKAEGIDLNINTFKKYISTEQPQDDLSKTFVIYNVGTGKFLTLGGYWDTHAMLSDVPHLFWMQRRNEKKQQYTAYLRYPETPGETIQSIYRRHNLTNLTSLQIGSEESSTRSHARYNYVRLVNEDGSYTNIFDEGYENSNKFKEQISFDGSKQHIEAEIDLSGCTGVNENILSVGSDIANWYNSSINLHLYYTKSGWKDGKDISRQLEIDYVDYTIKDGTKMKVTVDPSQPMTLKITQDGVYVNGTLIQDNAHTPTIEYDAERAGDIVRFKSNGIFLTDNNGNFIIDQNTGQTLQTPQNAYVYAYEKDNAQTYFISSRFNKPANDGKFLARTLYDANMTNVYGSVGIYGDRTITQNTTENSQWNFDRVDGEDGNVYTLSLYFSKGKYFPEEVADKSSENGFKVVNNPLEDGKRLYLQATNDMVKSGNLNDQFNGNYFNDPDGQNTTFDYAEALDIAPDATNKYAYWKILTLEEYYQLLQGKQSGAEEDHVNLSFILGDSNFDSENASLTKWQLEEMSPIKFGIDKYYKAQPSDNAYKNDWSSMAEANKHLNTLSRYFGVMAYSGARGRLYQDLDIYQPGWYTLTCGGMTNAGARLFVEKGNANKDSNGEDIFSAPISTPLVNISSDELAQLSGNVEGWPYREGMPMYNALVDINDEQMGKKKTYTNSLRFFVGNASNTAPVKIRFGIYIVDEDTPTTGDVPGALLAPQPRKAAATEEEFTVFDNFQLLYDGQSEMPNLVLSEDFTDLDYIEKAGYEYDLQPLHLKRTFTPNAWNTIVLPVDLSEQQVKAAFGENTKLARLHALTSNSVQFVYVEPNAYSGTYLRAFQPYLIKPEVKEGSQQEYSVEITMNDGEKKTVSIPANHFDIGYVTMAGKVTDENGAVSYPISTVYNNYIVQQTATGSNDNGTMTAKGTLCKTFETKSEADGGNSQGYAIISGRPNLKDCGAYIMKENVMYRVPDGQEYGLRGLRGWFEFTTPTSLAAPTSMKVDINGIQDDADSIDDIQQAGIQQATGKYGNGVFTINGTRLNATDASSLPAGLYIVNGRKVMVGQ